MKLKCSCNDFEEGLRQIIKAQTIAHHIEYTAPIIKYCPWCGNKLIKVDNES